MMSDTARSISGVHGDELFRSLERFVVDNPELERLEAQLAQFNMFESIGTTRQELHHSDFLAFLLRPHESHGIGDAFVKRLLQKSLNGLTVDGVSPIALHLWDLSDLTVQREWRHIDLLLVSDRHRLVVTIENKIGTGEHSGQLTRYREIIEANYPKSDDWQRVYLFLTPDAIAPTDSSYLSVGYDRVCECLDFLCENRAALLKPDVLIVVRHYVQMLRRQIVTDSQVSDLCQRIYQKHRQALDRIIQEVKEASRQEFLRGIIEEVISENETLILLSSAKGQILFAVRDWDNEPGLRQEVSGGKRNHILFFYMTNNQTGLKMVLYIAPGPQETRLALFNKARTSAGIFKQNLKTLRPKWTSIYQRVLVSETALTLDDAGLEEVARNAWREFVTRDLPTLAALVQPGDYPNIAMAAQEAILVEAEPDEEAELEN